MKATRARLEQAALWISSLLILGRIGAFSLDGIQGLQWDTGRLAVENAALRACWSSGQFQGCPGSGHFPLFQHLFALVLGYSGAQPFTIVRAMAILSFLAFIKTLLLGWTSLGTKRALRPLWVLLLATSPLLYYAQSSFGEMLATSLILCATAACLSDLAPIWIAASVALAGITKEFAPAFLCLIGLVAACVKEGGRLDPSSPALRRRLATVVSGAVLAAVANAGFNFVRFGVPWNAILLGPTMAKVPLLERPSFFMGIWLSPNAGILFFWPAFVALVAGLGFQLRGSERRMPIYGVLLLLGLLTLGLSGWWAPFGWICWGPRLALPWLPACILLLLHAFPAESGALLSEWGKGARLAILAAFTIVGFSQFCALFGYSVIGGIFGPGPGCPVIPPHPEQDPVYYFHCMRIYVWDPRIRIDELFASGIRPPATLFAGAYLVALWSWGVAALRTRGYEIPGKRQSLGYRL